MTEGKKFTYGLKAIAVIFGRRKLKRVKENAQKKQRGKRAWEGRNLSNSIGQWNKK